MKCFFASPDIDTAGCALTEMALAMEDAKKAKANDFFNASLVNYRRLYLTDFPYADFREKPN